jgi:UDP-2,3-diacylglucosamine hydrolase
MAKNLAILAGGGALPGRVAAGALAQGFAVQVVVFNGQPQPEKLPKNVPVRAFGLGQVGAILAHLKASGVTHVCLAGGLSKPGILSLRPDALGLKVLLRAVSWHDDALLRAVTSTLAEYGLTVVAPHTLVPGLVLKAGHYGVAASKGVLADAAVGANVLKALGKLDIGQACVVHKGVVLGVEAVEGTDALLARCAPLRGSITEPAGLLIKRAKQGQTELADLPFVGNQTLKNLARFGYAGLVVQAGKTLTDDVEALGATAKKLKLVCDAVS